MCQTVKSRHVVACDDGRVRKLGWRSSKTIVACVKWRISPPKPVNAALGTISVDGLDATSIVSHMIAGQLLCYGCPLLVDSLTIAGFNIISPPGVKSLAGSPTIAVYNYKPSLESLRRGLLASSLPFLEERLRVLELLSNSTRASTGRGVIYIVAWGLGREEAISIVESTQVHARKPEPLRIAHYTASEASLALEASGALS